MNKLRYTLQVALMTVIISAGLLSISQGELSAELTTRANHDHINIDFLYHGSTVSVRGVSDPGTDLVIKITSEGGHHSLRQKGRVGVLWMNVGTLKFDHVPSVYFLQSTKNIDDILPAEEQMKYSLGYKALAAESEITPLKDPAKKEEWFNEFLKYKEASKVYSIASGKISLTQKDGKQNYYILMDWPYQAAPGDYLVNVYAVKDKKVVEQAQAKVVVQQVGVIKSLAGMARNNGAFYGLISVLVALGAGFGVGLIFRKGGGAH
jgi:uncharacterized protein (TIGR02186 family)